MGSEFRRKLYFIFFPAKKKVLPDVNVFFTTFSYIISREEKFINQLLCLPCHLLRVSIQSQELSREAVRVYSDKRVDQTRFCLRHILRVAPSFTKESLS